MDPRDGVAKLFELNCRPGYRVWCSMASGDNIPWLCLQIERGERVEPLVPPAGLPVFLSPLEDALAFGASLVDFGPATASACGAIPRCSGRRRDRATSSGDTATRTSPRTGSSTRTSRR